MREAPSDFPRVLNGRVVEHLTGHNGGVYGVAMTQDGKWAVSTSGDQTIKVLDLETRALVATFTCDAATHCCAFVGVRRIIAGDAGSRVHFLSLELKEDK